MTKQNKAFTLKSKAFKGFTLIEMLVVISIIGILATIIIANMTGVRERARDARRKSDINQIQKAIQLYINDNKKVPYTLACSCKNDCPYPSDDHGRWHDTLAPLLAPYINPLPVDPINNDPNRLYQYTYGCRVINGNYEYEIEARLENASDADAQNDGGDSTTLYEKGSNLTINPRSWY